MGLHPQNSEVPFVWPGNDSDDERHSGSIYQLIPSMQKFRGNLTALSQVYNLYFSAYQGRIFVYRPRAAPSQALPSQPDLQLKPKASSVARLVGGALDESRPHIVNHMTIGFLGDEEIVLACYDDGDVVAYYTKALAKQIFTCRDTADALHKTKTAPKQFFHENVGISAWGLAVHQKSRLIAVSSNRHEVVVFALALTQNPPSRRKSVSRMTHPAIQTRTRNWRIVIRLPPAADNIPNVCFVDDCQGNAQRVGAVDVKGNAWLADIWQGNVGPIEIRPISETLIRSEEFYPAPSRGWGIFALDEGDFLKVKTTEELFGLPSNQLEIVPAGNGQSLVNIRNAISKIPDHPQSNPQHLHPPLPHVMPATIPGPAIWDPVMLQPWFAMPDGTGLLGSDGSDVAGEDEFEDTEESEEEGDTDDDSEVDTEAATVTVTGWSAINHIQGHAQEHGNDKSAASLPDNLYAWDATLKLEDLKEWQHGKKDANEDAAEDMANSHMLDMTYFPHSNTVQPTPRSTLNMMAFLGSSKSTEHNRHSLTPQAHLADLGKKLFLLRTYEKDIELRSFGASTSEESSSELGVVCPDVLTFGRFRNVGLRGHFHATSRLNMIALAPELSLMAIGSPTGRVVLITLTRKACSSEHHDCTWEHGFRVEWVLPTGSDEIKHRKTLRPMHGMALGPVQVGDDIGGKVGSGGPAMPRRYRLMLHYRNHDILSYELTREEQTGKLCIF
ncbi:crt10 protein [Fusarium longipes]|uniref:Crt10 protein n=1 Tax=Fusarium longipes TaxID=694270 RepID=A0A395S4G6_9HYPO|nr:crt10 protein [Fusarium longipes]